MRLSKTYSLIAAKPIPYVRKQDLHAYHGPDRARREWQRLNLPKLGIYKNDRYTFNNKVGIHPRTGQQVFEYVAGQKKIWINSHKQVMDHT